ncbi:MAG: alginate export family protein [bacterium]|nr:alginate export family protein [bacterium]
MSMWKRILVAVAVVAMAIPAFSAVESVKVGGDIDIYGIKRMNMYPTYYPYGDEITHLQTNTRVYVQAMLTENVEAMVRLINERIWWGSWTEIMPGSDTDIDLDLAYIKVSDILTPGLVLTVGRQEIQFGEGLVVGSAYVPFDTYPTTLPLAQDLGKQKAFDAVRIDYTFNQVPLDLTAFGAKIWETLSDNDGNLYGINLGFKAGDAARIEGYYVTLQDYAVDEDVSTVGIRATGDLAGFALKGEYAKQFGEWDGADNEGWALLLSGQYNFPQSEMAAYIKAQLNLYSGNDGDADNTQWISFFPSNVASRIGAINYILATTVNPYGLSNARVINVGGGISPVEKVAVSLDWFNVSFMEEAGWNDETAVGNEIDAGLTYKYSEDLSFGLQYGVLLLGDAIQDYFDDDPWQLIASMKVVF